MVRLARAALVKLDAGEFGRCEDCDDPIPTPRLARYPELPTCVPCATVRESTKALPGEPDRVRRVYRPNGGEDC